ncbi:hypothetical protein D3C78_1841050 [compost metagenome]
MKWLGLPRLKSRVRFLLLCTPRAAASTLCSICLRVSGGASASCLSAGCLLSFMANSAAVAVTSLVCHRRSFCKLCLLAATAQAAGD